MELNMMQSLIRRNATVIHQKEQDIEFCKRAIGIMKERDAEGYSHLNIYRKELAKTRTQLKKLVDIQKSLKVEYMWEIRAQRLMVMSAAVDLAYFIEDLRN